MNENAFMYQKKIFKLKLMYFVIMFNKYLYRISLGNIIIFMLSILKSVKFILLKIII